MPVPRPIPGLRITSAQITNSTLANLTTITDLTASGNITVGGTLDVTGATTVDDVTIGGDLDHNGTNIGFFSTAPTTQQTALTAQHATLTQAGTDTGDVAIQAAVDSGAGSAWGFANAAEFEAVVACVLNLMVRVQELEDKLQAYGLLA